MGCGVLSVSLVSEQGDMVVREEEFVEVDLAISHAAARDHSKQNVAKQLKQLAQQEHDGNKAARHEMRNAAAASTEGLLKVEFASLERRARRKVHSAAKAAAAAEAQKHTHQSSSLSIGTEKKLALLRKQKELMDEAVKKAQAGAAKAHADARKEAGHFQKIVNAQLSKAKDRFNTLQKKLAAYKGTKRSKKKAQQQLVMLHQKIAHVGDHLAAKKSRLSRALHRQHRHVQKTKTKIKKSKHKLKKLLMHYQVSLKGLKTKLHTVNMAPISMMLLGRESMLRATCWQNKRSGSAHSGLT